MNYMNALNQVVFHNNMACTATGDLVPYVVGLPTSLLTRCLRAKSRKKRLKACLALRQFVTGRGYRPGHYIFS